MLGNYGRAVSSRVFTPVARWLLRRGVGPNTVSVTGTVLSTIAALTLLGTGQLVIGPIVLGLLLLTDSLDGVMAREGEGPTNFGAFLDSTLDRLADSAVFLGVLLYFVHFAPAEVVTPGSVATAVCLALGLTVSYVRAKAESLGRSASVGLAERADRLVVTLVATFAVGLGASPWLLVFALAALAAASVLTIYQRIRTVWQQERRR